MRVNDHGYYEELTVLAAGGFLSDQEQRDLREHTTVCGDCRKAEAEFANLVRFQLPLTVSPLREFFDKLQTRPDEKARELFLQRARREGIRFSPAIEQPTKRRAAPRTLLTAAAGALAAFIVVAAIYKTPNERPLVVQQQPLQAPRLISELKAENTTLTASLAQSNQQIASQRQEIERLQNQLKSEADKADTFQKDGEKSQSGVEQATQRNAELVAQIQDRDKLLADAQSELAKIKDERTSDEASLVAQQTHINELSDQLRIANADLALERQLASAGKDVRELMGARKLHVVDVRDTDPSGNSSKPFGRVFLTEGKSLIFYAFDLNENKVAGAKHNFEVWGEQQGKKGSVRSLGFLYADNKAQRRWALKVENPDLIAEIDSVFVTVESPDHSKEPTGQRMLYAYLGDANHP